MATQREMICLEVKLTVISYILSTLLITICSTWWWCTHSENPIVCILRVLYCTVREIKCVVENLIMRYTKFIVIQLKGSFELVEFPSLNRSKTIPLIGKKYVFFVYACKFDYFDRNIPQLETSVIGSKHSNIYQSLNINALSVLKSCKKYIF